MTINFPNSPTLNEEYSAEDRTWAWNGRYWKAVSVTVGYTGSQGDLGYTGSAGTDGADGAIGFTGSAGFTGSVGFVGSAGSNGDVGFTGSQGDIGYTGSQGESGLSVLTIYNTVADLPESADTGAFALVADISTLYAYTGLAWVDTSANLRNYFYIVQTSAFASTITGNVGFVPTRTIQLQSIEASVASKTSNITIRVRKNSSTLQEFVISGDSLSVTGDFSSNTFTTSDTVFMDIIAGAGVDLAVKFNYK